MVVRGPKKASEVVDPQVSAMAAALTPVGDDLKSSASAQNALAGIGTPTKKQTFQEKSAAANLAKEAALAEYPEPVEWINGVFGADAMNNFNKLALVNFLTGKTKTFEGLANPKWLEGFEKLGISISERGDRDKGKDVLQKLRAAYQSRILDTAQNTQGGPQHAPKAHPSATEGRGYAREAMAHSDQPTHQTWATRAYSASMAAELASHKANDTDSCQDHKLAAEANFEAGNLSMTAGENATLAGTKAIHHAAFKALHKAGDHHWAKYEAGLDRALRVKNGTGQSELDKSLAFALEQMTRPDLNSRLFAAGRLKDFTSEKAFQGLCTLAKAPEWQVRRMAVASLGESKLASGKKLKDEEDELLPSAFLEVVDDLMVDPDDLVRLELSRFAAVLTPPEGYPFALDTGNNWRGIAKGDAQPTPQQVRLLESVVKVLDQGVFYESDFYHAVLKDLPEGFFSATDMTRQASDTGTVRGMVGSEIYDARHYEEDRRNAAMNRAAAGRFSVGDVLRDLRISGENYSKLTVQEVDRERGFVVLNCSKRGTRNTWKVGPMEARVLAEKVDEASQSIKEG